MLVFVGVGVRFSDANHQSVIRVRHCAHTCLFQREALCTYLSVSERGLVHTSVCCHSEALCTHPPVSERGTVHTHQNLPYHGNVSQDLYFKHIKFSGVSLDKHISKDKY